MQVHFKRVFSLMLICLLLLVSLAGCGKSAKNASSSRKKDYTEASTGQTEGSFDQGSSQNEGSKVPTLDQDGSYTSKEDVSLYLVEYGELPKNFITKKEARSLGWSGGSLEPYAPGKCIGGDRFGNYEGNLPEVEGRTYYECDIDTLGAKSRWPKRIVYSDDGQVYYTEDHYETFTLLYGDDEE